MNEFSSGQSNTASLQQKANIDSELLVQEPPKERGALSFAKIAIARISGSASAPRRGYEYP